MQAPQRLYARQQTQAGRIADAERHVQRVLVWPSGGGINEAKLAFGIKLSGNVVTVYAGTIRAHGIRKVAVAQTNVTLSGATEWIYVEWGWFTSASIKHSSVEPESNATYLRWALAKYTLTSGAYALTQRCWMGGDIHLAAPIRIQT